VHGLAADGDAAEREIDVMPRSLVVVAGNVDDLGAFARLPEYLLDDVVVRLMPVPAAFELPGVDDVADEIQVVRFGVTQEIEVPAFAVDGVRYLSRRCPATERVADRKRYS